MWETRPENFDMTAPDPELVERLAAHKTLGSAPRKELEWLAAHGTIKVFEANEVVGRKGVPVEAMYILFTGHTVVFVDRGGGRHKVLEWRGGEVTGMLPYSRMTTPPGDSLSVVRTESLAIHREDFPEMIRECHGVTSILVGVMLDRARIFTASGLQDEKMASLGRLAAGLAHELNNPASAIERGAALLVGRLEEAQRSARTLGTAGLDAAQLAAVDRVREACVTQPATGVLSPLQQAEREEALSDWMTEHGIDDPSVATSLADTGMSLSTLDGVAAVASGPALEAALRSIAAECAVRGIASDVLDASTRIAGLVLAIKGFTHMDQAAVAEPVDLRTSLRNTVAVLKSKARAKSASVTVDLEQGLPRVRAFAGELNQIWANLIDNALDAVPDSGKGHVVVKAAREHDQVVVRVVDDGPGIPPEVRARIFEPFFTTKAVGQGTGLGLDIVRRLVIHNDAEIEVDSEPGRTEFRVTLPIAERESESVKPKP
jgi:signal transduction histidine kinase